jgi:hypothetical protein
LTLCHFPSKVALLGPRACPRLRPRPLERNSPARVCHAQLQYDLKSCIQGFKGLLRDLESRHGQVRLLARKANQDPLESTFGVMRQVRPTPRRLVSTGAPLPSHPVAHSYCASATDVGRQAGGVSEGRRHPRRAHPQEAAA